MATGIGSSTGAAVFFALAAAYICVAAHPRWRKAIRWRGRAPASAFSHIVTVVFLLALGSCALADGLGYRLNRTAVTALVMGCFFLCFLAGGLDAWRSGRRDVAAVIGFVALWIVILAFLYFVAVPRR